MVVQTVREALVAYEPRIDVLDVNAETAPEEPNLLLDQNQLPDSRQQRARQSGLPVLHPRGRLSHAAGRMPFPQIDDRRYDSLLAEVRTRIARYTPEWTPVWTDVNDSDPGITMVQVFAWLAEMLTYRMSKVPELNYIKFLQLLGIELNPAEPAQAEITFPVKPIIRSLL